MTEPIHPLVLHESTLELRTWFSTNGSSFELLSPDVPILVCNYSTFDTGEMVIVAKDDRGDFDDIQDAIDCVATNNDADAILVMPGHYGLSASLTFPTNKSTYIRGAANELLVRIENNSGPAIVVSERASVFLEDLIVRGQPAISDSAATSWCAVRLRNCTVERSGGTTGAAIELSVNGDSRATGCDIRNYHGGNALLLSGASRFKAEQCDISAGGGGDVILLNGLTGNCILDGCSVDTSQAARSLVVDGGNAWRAFFTTTEFGNGVLLSNTTVRVEFHRCTLLSNPLADTLSVVGGSGLFIIQACQIYGNNANRAVRVVGGDNVFQFADSEIWATDATAMSIEDATGWNRIDHCKIESNKGIAIEVSASSAVAADAEVWVDIERSRVANYGDGVAANTPAVVISNAAANPGKDTWAGVDVYLADIDSSIGDGVKCSRGEIDSWGSFIEGDEDSGRDGIMCTSSEVDVERSELEGGRAGIWAVDSEVGVGWASEIEGDYYGVHIDGGELDIEMSFVEAGDDDEDGHPGNAIHAIGDVAIMVANSIVQGYAPDSDPTGRGIYAALTGVDSDCHINNSKIHGRGTGIRISGVTGGDTDLDIYCSVVEGEASDGIGMATGETDVTSCVVKGGDVGVRAVDAEVDLTTTSVDGEHNAVDCDGALKVLDCVLSADQGTVLEIRDGMVATDDVHVERSRLRLDNETVTDSVVRLHGAGWNTAPCPPAFQGTILKSVSTNAHLVIGLSGGATTANVFMVNCGMSAGVDPSIGKLAPDSTDSYGNYVIPAAAR